MKKLLLILLTTFLFGGQIHLTKEEQEYLKHHNTITVHNEDSWPPFNFNIGGNPLGFSIDYIRLIANKLHIKVKFISGHTWNQFLDMAKHNQIDVILNIRKTKDREKYLSFTSAYITSKKSIFTNIPNIVSIKDLANKVVAVPEGYVIHNFLKEHYPHIKLLIKKTTFECILAVINQNADAIIEDFSVVNNLLQNNSLSLKYKHIVSDTNLPEDINIAVPKNNIILRNILQKAMDSISHNELTQLKHKWFIANNTNFFNKLTLREKKYIQKHKVIRMCNNPEWEPIEFVDHNKVEGISIDTLDILEKKLKIKFKHIPTKNWAESQQYLKEKRCDILPSAVKTVQRLEYANFTSSYLHFPLAIFTRNDKPIVSGLDDIIDKTWTRQKGSGLINKLKKEYPFTKVIETNNNKEAFQYVSNGKAYFTISSLPAASSVISKYMINNLHIVGYTGITYDLAIAVNKDDAVLLSILNKALEDISQSQLKSIVKKWVNTPERVQTIDYKIIAQIAVVIVIILLIGAYRNHLLTEANKNLKEAVEQKTKELQEINENLEDRIEKEIQKVKTIEYKLFETEKLAAMGEMIGNIAHQWRQPLSTITTISTGIIIQKQRDLLTDDNLLSGMEDINNSAKFLSKTIDDFRDLIKGDAKIEKINLSSVLQQCFDIEKSILNINNIVLVTNLDDNIVIYSYKNAVIQAVINILNNAKDALLENKIEDKYIFIDTYIQDNEVKLEIKDNAGGIPKEIMSRIFEAYFTTKHKSSGTGLGLNITYNIVTKDMNSRISAQNIEFEYNAHKYYGAQFLIEIPLSK